MRRFLSAAAMAALLSACGGGAATEYAETYDCTCGATYEDDVSYYEDTTTGSYCMEPDEAEYVLQDAVDQCVVDYESLGYYNVVCECECAPTGFEC